MYSGEVSDQSMGRRRFETISFRHGAYVADNMGVLHMDISQKVGNLVSSDPQSHRFWHGIQGGEHSGGREKVRGPKSAISVTDLGRRCTVGTLLISQWAEAHWRPYLFSLAPRFLTTLGSARWVFPRKSGIWKVRPPTRAILDMDSRAVSTVGIASMFSNRFGP